jgi:hypothetical protein
MSAVQCHDRPPRFEPIRSALDQAQPDYNGGRLVDMMLSLVECWLPMSESRPPGLRGRVNEMLLQRLGRDGPSRQRFAPICMTGNLGHEQ